MAPDGLNGLRVFELRAQLAVDAWHDEQAARDEAALFGPWED